MADEHSRTLALIHGTHIQYICDRPLQSLAPRKSFDILALYKSDYYYYYYYYYYNLFKRSLKTYLFVQISCQAQYRHSVQWAV